MPTSVDNRVVKMEFDNESFERKTKESMSTLDKLKESLNFDETGKALDKLSKSTKNFSMDNVSNAVSSAAGSFSVFETIATGVLLRLGAQITDFAERQVKKLALDQVLAGWDKYTAKIESVQTILNSTRDMGENIDSVNDKMAELNWFTDETSYNFADMSSNIGKFTANGQDLAESTTAMMGIANWAALSGAKVQQMSMAMYNLSQALGTGALMTKDWMSVENANMATREFKKLAIQTAETMGVLEEGAVTVGTFRESLSTKWFTSDVLMEVLNQYGAFTDRLYYYVEGTGVTASQYLGYIDDFKSGAIEWAEVEKETGLSHERLTAILEDLSQAEYELGLKGLKAGQESKTLTDSIDATADAVSTLWMNVYEGIFGNYEQAKVLWTDVTEYLWDIFAAPVDSLNSLVQGTFADSFDKLSKQIKGVGGNLDDFEEALRRVAIDEGFEDITEQYERMSQALREGAFGDDQVRIVKKVVESYAQALRESKDVTDEQIIALDELEASLENTDDGVGYFIETLDQVGTRQHIFDIITNSLNGLEEIITVVSDAFGAIFPAPTADMIKEAIANIAELTEKFHLLADFGGKTFHMGAGYELFNMLKGIFGVLDIGLNALKSGINFVLPYVKLAIDQFLRWGGVFGKGLEALDTFVKKTDIFNRTFHAISSVISTVADKFDTLFKALTGYSVGELFDKIEHGLLGFFDGIANEGPSKFEKVVDWFKGVQATLKEYSNKLSAWFKDLTGKSLVEWFSVAHDQIASFISWVGEKLPGVFTIVQTVIGSVANFFRTLWGNIQEIFGGKEKIDTSGIDQIEEITNKIDENVTHLSKTGENIKNFFGKLKGYFDTFIGYLKTTAGTIWEAVKSVAGGFKTYFADFDVKKLFAMLAGGGVFAKGLGEGIGKAEFLGGIGSFFKKLGDLAENLGKGKEKILDILDGVKGILKAYSTEIKADALKKIAVAVLELAAAVILMSAVDTGGLARATAVITMLFIELEQFIKKLNEIFKKTDVAKEAAFTGVAAGITAIGTAVLMLAGAVVVFSLLDTKKLASGLTGVLSILALLGIMMKNANFKDMDLGSAATIAAMALMVQSMGLVIAELSIIAALNPEGNVLLTAVLTMGALLAELAGVMYLLKNISVPKETSLAIITLALAVDSMGLVIAELALIAGLDKDGNALVGAAATIAAVLLGLSVAIKMMDDVKVSPATSLAIITLAVAVDSIGIVVAALSLVASRDLTACLVAAGIITVLMAEMAGVMRAIKEIKVNASTIAAIASMALAMTSIAAVISILGLIASEKNLSEMVIVAGMIAGIMIALGGAVAIANIGTSSLSAAAGIVAIAAAILLLTPALAAFSALENPWQAIGLLAGALAALLLAGEAMKVLGLDHVLQGIAVAALTFAAAAVVAAAAVDLFGIGLKLIAEGIMGLVVAVSTAIAILGTESTASMVAVMVNLILAACEAIIQTTPEIFHTLRVLTLELVAFLIDEAVILAEGVFQLIVRVLALLTTYVGAIIDGLVSLLLTVINGFANTIRARSSEIMNAIWNVISALAELVLEAISSTVTRIVGIFSKTAAEKVSNAFDDAKFWVRDHLAPDLADTVTTTVDTVVDAGVDEIDERSPDVKKKAFDLGSLFGDGASGGILDSLPELMGAGEEGGSAIFNGASKFLNEENGFEQGFDFGVGINNGYESTKEENEATGEEMGSVIADSIADGMGISSGNTKNSKPYSFGHEFGEAIDQGMQDQKPSLVDTSSDMTKSIINSFSGMEKDGEEISKNLILGLVKGLKNNSYYAEEAASNVASNVIKKTKNTYQVKSPSRIFEGIGRFLMLGEAKGIKKNSYIAENATEESARQTVARFNNAIRPLASLIDGMIDSNPVITPVLDLSNIQNGAKSIGGYFRGARAIALGSAVSAGSSISGDSTVINMTINGAPGQDVDELADIISERISVKIGRGKRVWA